MYGIFFNTHVVYDGTIQRAPAEIALVKRLAIIQARARSMVTALLVAVLAGGQIPAHAAPIPTGFQVYHIIGDEQQVWEMLEQTADLEDDGVDNDSSILTDGMLSVITATASSDNQIIVYDHWEDGFETGLIDPTSPNFLNPPAGSSTLVFGDGDSSNGRACDFLAGAVCTGSDPVDDLLNEGDTLTLNSDEGTAPTCTATSTPLLPTPPYAASPQLTGCVPLNVAGFGPDEGAGATPGRDPADLRFDGGDYMAGSGGALTVIHIQDPSGSGGFIAGASEMISQQAVGDATSYSVPVGEDTYGGNNTVTEPFKYVDLNLVAFEDTTSVSITSPGAGSVSFTLNQGQHYSSFSGTIEGDGTDSFVGTLVINEGSKVSTNKALSGLIFTGADGTFQTRFYTLLPDLLHSTDYITTAPGDDSAVNGNRPLNLYIFNPDPINTIAVDMTDSLGTPTGVIVPANSQVGYFTAPGRFPPADSTVRLTSDSNFWGISAYTHQSTANDWGHSWLATEFLTDTYTVSFSPDTSFGGGPVHIAPISNNTCVRVDFDNDGVFDEMSDLVGGTVAHAGGTCADGYLVDAIESLAITDPRRLRQRRHANRIQQAGGGRLWAAHGPAAGRRGTERLRLCGLPGPAELSRSGADHRKIQGQEFGAYGRHRRGPNRAIHLDRAGLRCGQPDKSPGDGSASLWRHALGLCDRQHVDHLSGPEHRHLRSNAGVEWQLSRRVRGSGL